MNVALLNVRIFRYKELDSRTNMWTH